MDNHNKKPPKKPPFPAMSAHFAHTLDDMAEQYIQAQYIELSAATGILEPEKLKKLNESRSNLIVYEGKVFRFSRKENHFLKYVCLFVDGMETDVKGQQAVIEDTSGEWVITDLTSEAEHDIEDLKEEVNELKIHVQHDIADLREDLEEGLNDLQGQIDSLKMDGGEVE